MMPEHFCNLGAIRIAWMRAWMASREFTMLFLMRAYCEFLTASQVVDMPLLFETGANGALRPVVLIACDSETQVRAAALADACYRASVRLATIAFKLLLF